jgi:cupin superfamily acireductone dioxygenase involved in methionine salvage
MRNEQKIETVRTEINALRTEMNVRFESVDRRFDNMQKDMNTRFDSVNSRIDDVKEQMGFMTTLLIFVLGGLMSLIGFVIYDRRTAIKPVQRSQEKLEDILVEYSKENKKLREILKNAGIL